MIWIHDIIYIVLRVLSIMPLLLVITLLMGKRSFSEVPVFDVLILLVLGEVVGADLSDPRIPIRHAVLTSLLLGVIQIIVSNLVIRFRRFGRLLTFEPTLVIRDGRFLDSNLRRIRYSIDNILQMLRENNTFNVADVEMAVVEANGRLTVLKKPGKQTVTLDDIGKPAQSSLALPVIVEGKVYRDTLQGLGVSEPWLREQLQGQGLAGPEDVFFASLNQELQLHVSRRGEKDGKIPLFH